MTVTETQREPHRHARDIQPAPSAGPNLTQTGSKVAKVGVALLSIGALALSGTGYYTVGKLGNDVASASNLGLTEKRSPKAKTLDGAVDILLVGTDSRTDAQGQTLSDEELARLNAGVDDGEENTDTIIVVRVPADGSRATAVSIPRDTYIQDPKYGNMKINGVYGAHHAGKAEELAAQGKTGDDAARTAVEAGRAGLIDAVAKLTGVDVDHYAEVGLHGFVALTDAVGGVEVCLNEAIQDPYSGANFQAGPQVLNGAQALAFVRQRHGLPRGDLDRIARQQAYMASLVHKALSTGTLTNPRKLSDMSQAVEKSVIIDEGWNIASFATQMSDLAGGNVTFSTIPVTSIDGTGDYGESIVTVDAKEVQNFFKGLSADQEHPEIMKENARKLAKPSVIDALDIHVLNAGTVSGMAGSVGTWLEEQGLIVPVVANAQPGVYTKSQVVASFPGSAEAKALSQMLGGLEITPNPTLDASTLVVVVGDDYAGPSSRAAQLESSDALSNAAPIGKPGADFGHAEVAPEFTAGGTGVRCVN